MESIILLNIKDKMVEFSFLLMGQITKHLLFLVSVRMA